MKNEIEEDRFAIKPKKAGHFEAFKNNLLEGINYYEKTFTEEVISLYNFRDNILEDLKRLRTEINAIDTKPVVVGEMVIAH